MNKILKTETYLWFLPVFLLFHNVEEWFGSEKMFIFLKTNFPSIFHTIIKYLKFSDLHSVFGISLILVTVLPFIITYFYIYKPLSIRYRIIYDIFISIIILNSLQHIIISILKISYFSGLITAIFLNLPFCIIYFKNNIIKDYKSYTKITELLLWSMVIYVFVIVLSLFTGFVIFRAIYY